MKKIVIVLTVMMWGQNINAQNIFNFQNKEKSVYGQFGIEPTYNLAIGYMQCFSLKKVKRNIVVYGEIGSSLKMIGLKNYEAKVGGILDLLKVNSFGVTYDLNFSTGHVQTKNFDSQKFAFSNKFLVGYFNNKWFVAFSGEHEKIYANNMKHTQYYKDYIYPEAKDGWYNGAGGNIQLGIETGITLKETIDLKFNFKIPKSEKFNSYNGSPAHTNLSIAYRL
ncbi:MAG: hypothetical protein Sapg2KO_50880 [Saprospiraceae bacterium]